MHVCAVGFIHEANTFRPPAGPETLCTATEFPTVSWQGQLLDGAAQVLDSAGIVMTVDSWVETVPGIGPLDHAATEGALARTVNAVRHAAPDAVLACIHGASVSVDFPSTDVELLRRLREVTGADCPIVVVNDPHGNIHPGLPSLADGLFGYRTTPHRDHATTGARAARLLSARLHGAGRAAPVIVHPPILVKGSLLSFTEEIGAPVPPAFSRLQRTARQLENSLGIQDISVNAGQGSSDVSHAGVSIVVNAPPSDHAAQEAAARMAGLAWELRDSLDAKPVLVSPDDAVSRALRRPGHTYLIDEGTDVGGGGANDGVEILAALARHNWPKAVLTLTDPGAVGYCAGRVGQSSVRVTLRCRDPLAARDSLDIVADSVAVHADATAVRVGGTIIRLTSAPAPATGPADYRRAGLDIDDATIIVVSASSRRDPHYVRAGDSLVSVNTTGASNPDPTNFTYRALRRPLFPLDSLRWGGPDFIAELL